MSTIVLVLVFLDSLGKVHEIRVDNPRSDLMEAELLVAMNLIIAKNIFAIDTLVSAESAYMLTTTTQEIFNQVV